MGNETKRRRNSIKGSCVNIRSPGSSLFLFGMYCFEWGADVTERDLWSSSFYPSDVILNGTCVGSVRKVPVS